MNLSFENKVALVTGAGSGMGLATAKAFAEAGAAVVLADIDENAVRSAAEELVSAGHKAIAVQPNAVLYLHVVRRPPCVAERERTDKLARATRPRGELPRERGRLIGGEVGQGQIRERSEQIRRLVRHVRIAAQLGGELESVLVAGAEPRQLVQQTHTVGCRRRVE